MVFGIPTEQIIPVANFIGLGILGILAYFGQRWGKARPTPGEKQLEVAGALVDSTAVNQLAAAIEAHTLEAVAQRNDAEKTRKVGHELREQIGKLTDEVNELRDEMARRR